VRDRQLGLAGDLQVRARQPNDACIDRYVFSLLRQNEFNPSWALCSTFTSAINNSRLKALSLNSNAHLGDTFLFRFLSDLCTPHLHELHLSAMNLTSVSTPHLVAFLSSDPPTGKHRLLPTTSGDNDPITTPRRTRLRDLRLNGNHFTLSCATSLVSALETANFSLRHVEMYANDFQESGPSSSPPVGKSWEDLKIWLAGIYSRNHRLTERTKISALRLLSPARCLLLQPLEEEEEERSTSSSSSWRALPMELRLHILFFVSPTLSPSQHIRIWKYASDRGTLPRFLAANLPQKTKDRMRDEFVESVGCERFEWYERWQEDFGFLKW